MSIQMIPYIFMNGRAKEAIKFYQEALNAAFVFQQSYGDGPGEEVAKLNEEERNLVAHAILKIGDAQMMVADATPGMPVQEGNQVSICVTCNDVSLAKQFYENLKQDGTVLFEMAEMYFSPAYGMVTDKFGVTFQIFTIRS